MTPTEKLLIQLLKIPSVSNNETELLNFLVKKLQSEFIIEKITVSENRFNILCKHGNLDKLLVAHIDTVAGEVPITVSDRVITGRGSCDNKGAAAAMITATSDAKNNGLNNFGLLFTIGEETSFDGAIAVQRFFEENKIKPKLVVIGEPTELEVVTAQYGLLCLKICCSGTSAHSSTDNPDSAIHKLVRILNEILKQNYPETVFHIGLISGGKAENVIADSAEATLLFRSALVDIKKLVNDSIAKMNIPSQIIIEKELQAVNNNSLGFEHRAVTYFTEMAFLKNSVVLGPGSIINAHTANEFVDRKQLNMATKKYLDILSSSK